MTIIKPNMASYEVAESGLDAARSVFNAKRMKATPMFIHMMFIDDQYIVSLVNKRGTASQPLVFATWDELRDNVLTNIDHGPRETFYICPECDKLSPTHTDPGVTRPYQTLDGTKTTKLDCDHIIIVAQENSSTANDDNTRHKENNVQPLTSLMYQVEVWTGDNEWEPFEEMGSTTEVNQFLADAFKAGDEYSYRVTYPNGRQYRYDMAIDDRIHTYEMKFSPETLGTEEPLIVTGISNRPSPSILASMELVNEMRLKGKAGACEDPHGRDHLVEMELARRNMVWVEPSIDNPNWVYAELQGLLDRNPGAYLNVEQIKSHYGDPVDADKLMERMFNGSFGFSDHNSTTIITLWIDGKRVSWEDFPKYLEMEFKNGPKISKRFKEITRRTLLWFNVDPTTLRWHWVPVPKGEMLTADGNIIFSDRLLKEAAMNIPEVDVRKHFLRDIRPSMDLPSFGGASVPIWRRQKVRFNIRFNTPTFECAAYPMNNGVYPGGLIKGDGEGIPHQFLQAAYEQELGYTPDIIMGYEVNDDGSPVGIYDINTKAEIKSTNGFMRCSFNAHHDVYRPWTNDLMPAMAGPELFPESHLIYADTRYLKENEEALMAGNFPAYMDAAHARGAKNKTAGNPKGTPNFGEIIKNISWDWTFSRNGISAHPLRESTLLMKLITQGFRKHIDRRNGIVQYGRPQRVEGSDRLVSRPRMDRFNNEVRKGMETRLPIPCATLGNVLALRMVHMAGYKPEEYGYDTTKVFYFEPMHSIVYPNQLFIVLAPLHGGWDGDDKSYVMVRDAYEGKEHLGIKGFGLRMPVGYGEWSFFDIDLYSFLPVLFHTRSGPGCPWGEDSYPKVDVTKLHCQSTKLEEKGLQQVAFQDPDTQLKHRKLDPNYTMDEAFIGIRTMLANPGVGRIINLLAVWASVTGLPFPKQSFRLEDYVDFCQQKYNLEAFNIINEDIKIFKKMILAITEPIDNWLWEARVRSEKPTSVNLVNDGYYSRLFRHQLSMVENWDKVAAKLLKGRTQIAELMEIELADDVKKEGRTLFNKFQQDSFVHFGAHSPANAQRLFRGNINRVYTQKLMEMDPKRRDLVLIAAYQYMIREGKPDNFFFQTPLLHDERSVLRLFIVALYNLGLARIIIQTGEGTFTVVEQKA